MSAIIRRAFALFWLTSCWSRSGWDRGRSDAPWPLRRRDGSPPRVEHPVETVLDRPMAAHGLLPRRQAAGGGEGRDGGDRRRSRATVLAAPGGLSVDRGAVRLGGPASRTHPRTPPRTAPGRSATARLARPRHRADPAAGGREAPRPGPRCPESRRSRRSCRRPPETALPARGAGSAGRRAGPRPRRSAPRARQAGIFGPEHRRSGSGRRPGLTSPRRSDISLAVTRHMSSEPWERFGAVLPSEALV